MGKLIDQSHLQSRRIVRIGKILSPEASFEELLRQAREAPKLQRLIFSEATSEELFARMRCWAHRLEIWVSITGLLMEHPELQHRRSEALSLMPEFEDQDLVYDRSFHDLCELTGVSDFISTYLTVEERSEILEQMNDQPSEIVLEALVEVIFGHLRCPVFSTDIERYSKTDPSLHRALSAYNGVMANPSDAVVQCAVDAYVTSYERRALLLRAYPVDQAGRLLPIADRMPSKAAFFNAKSADRLESALWSREKAFRHVLKASKFRPVRL